MSENDGEVGLFTAHLLPPAPPVAKPVKQPAARSVAPPVPWKPVSIASTHEPWTEKAMESAEEELKRVEEEGVDPLLVRRVRAWNLRLRGYSIQEIGEELRISIGSAHSDLKWCHENLPPAYETAEDFKRISLQQLDAQYRRVTSGRNGEPPTDIAERVAIAIKDAQAKLLGAYAPTRVDATVQTQYEIVGVETKDI